jgi:DNA-binding transcriptional LysR family regulator
LLYSSRASARACEVAIFGFGKKSIRRLLRKFLQNSTDRIHSGEAISPNPAQATGARFNSGNETKAIHLEGKARKVSVTVQNCMDLKIKQLECFLTVAETLHFGKAAQRLHISQPALTFQIQSMESSIGMQLFDRNRRSVALTETGRNLVVTGNRILTELRSFKESVVSLASEQVLRVVCAPAGEQVILPSVIRRLKQLTPHIRIDMVSLQPIEQTRALQDGSVDVLLMVRRVGVPGVAFQPITDQRLFAVVPEGSRFAQRGRISVHEFAAQPVIVASRQYCDKTQPLIEKLLAPYGVAPRFIEAPGRQSVQEAMVAAGMGVSLNTEWRLMAPFPGVKMIPFEEQIPQLQLGAAWRTSFESNALSTFKTALRDVIFDLGRRTKEPLSIGKSNSPVVTSSEVALF